MDRNGDHPEVESLEGDFEEGVDSLARVPPTPERLAESERRQCQILLPPGDRARSPRELAGAVLAGLRKRGPLRALSVAPLALALFESLAASATVSNGS